MVSAAIAVSGQKKVHHNSFAVRDLIVEGQLYTATTTPAQPCIMIALTSAAAYSLLQVMVSGAIAVVSG